MQQYLSHIYPLFCLMHQNYLKLEDGFEEKSEEMLKKIDTLESIVRLFEIKMRNAQEQSKLHLVIYIYVHCICKRHAVGNLEFHN